MPVRKILRTTTTNLQNNPVAGPAWNTIIVDSATDTLVFGTGASGTTTKTVADTTSTQTLTNKTLGSTTFSGLFYELAQNSVTAFSGGGQTSATQLTGQTCRVTTVAAIGDSVKLPVSVAGLEVLVINSGANAMQVFGAGTDTIDGLATATGVSQMVNSLVIYTCAAAGAWFSEGLATGYGGPGLQTVAFVNSITAFSGGGQSSAVALTGQYNRVSVAAASGDSVRLPTSAAGLQVTIDNQGANPIQVFGASTDTINGVATATGVSQPVKSIVTYYCTVAGNWETPGANYQPVGFATLTANGAIPPAVPQAYVVTKAGVLADTLAAPPASPLGDGIVLTITSDTAFAHTITATGLLDTGSANTNVATFAAFKGAGVQLVSYNARWKVLSSTGVTFS